MYPRADARAHDVRRGTARGRSDEGRLKPLRAVRFDEGRDIVTSTVRRTRRWQANQLELPRGRRIDDAGNEEGSRFRAGGSVAVASALGAGAGRGPATSQQPQPQAGARDAQKQGRYPQRKPRATSANRHDACKLKDRDLREVVARSCSEEGQRQHHHGGRTSRMSLVTIDLQSTFTWRQALDARRRAGRAASSPRPCRACSRSRSRRRRLRSRSRTPTSRRSIDTIGKISGANIVVAPEVKGTITIRLKNIPWRDALDAVGQDAGLRRRRGGRAASCASSRPSNIQQDLVTKTIPLRYVRPASELTCR